jgi:error-prone DNA polymerase
MDDWGERRDLLWQLQHWDYAEGRFLLSLGRNDVPLPPLSPLEAQLWEIETLGVSARPHLLTWYRDALAAQDILDSRTVAACRGGQSVTVAGQIAIHQAPPTARGTHFVTLEDEFGFSNLLIRPEVYPACRIALRESLFVVATGVIQKRSGAMNIHVRSVQRLALSMGDFAIEEMMPHKAMRYR